MLQLLRLFNRGLSTKVNTKYTFDNSVPKIKISGYVEQYLHMLGLDSLVPIHHIISITQQYDKYSLIQILHNRQMMKLPYTNIALVNYLDPETSMDAILHKTITEQKGGLCWELNGTFQFILNQLGLKTKMIICDQLTKQSRINQKNGVTESITQPEFTSENPHTAIIVEDKWFCDLGFGEYFRNPILMPNMVTDKQSGSTKDGTLIEYNSSNNYYYLKRPDENNRVFLRFVDKPHTISELFEKAVFYSDDPNSLWSVWTKRLYESRLVEQDGDLVFRTKIEKIR
ncbi:MAG: acetyltransferase [Homavirus sp.]|uniref:Acetyltransferase n=1 Tax=Homavirus sp. TaxID=2487769 RepID=A0A3G5A5A4_9VIRU|nr:MAG: acetyltransferase [Homavirus sp.]